jgi:hypothetical protein
MGIRANDHDIEIATELTLALIDSIKTNTSSTDSLSYNDAVVQEVTKAYEAILKVIVENSIQ